jgi:diguanylate cyclase (GGDEF)-like protein
MTSTSMSAKTTAPMSSENEAQSFFAGRAPVKRVIWLVGTVAMVLIIGYFDLVTGPDIGFALFYLLPIIMTAWLWSLAPAMGIALLASVARLVAALIGRGQDMYPVVIWNSFSRLVMFALIVYVIASLRTDRTRLVKLLSREKELARTDSLTHLLNWRGFEEQLKKEISRSRRNSQPLCVGYVDLDNFKRVNDMKGHGAGDECLERLGRVFKEALRPEDVVARVGGDEFAVLFSSSDPAAAEKVGRRLVELISAIGEQYPGTDLGASVGVVFFDRPPERSDVLIQYADKAMYRAKQAGKHTLVLERIGHRNSEVETT